MTDHEYGRMQTGDYWLRFTGGGPTTPVHVTAHWGGSIQEPVVITGAHTDQPGATWKPAWWPDQPQWRQQIETRAITAHRAYWSRVTRTCDG